MLLSKFRAGLDILSGYFDEDGYHLGAEHDVIFVHATDRPLSQEDLEKLIDLGWFQPEVERDENDDIDEDEYAKEHYDPEAGWAAYT